MVSNSYMVLFMYTMSTYFNAKNYMPLRELGFPGGSDGKASACSEGDPGWIPGSGDPLEKEMATHSSILAWRIPWMDEPDRL